MWYLFFVAFCGMELAAYFLHKYVMHGFLWNLHEDHHEITKKLVQRNDFFALFFAVPSFLLILGGSLQSSEGLLYTGFGMTAYGFCYFFIHELIIHQRLKFKFPRNPYFNALIRAHRQHHSVRTKEGAFNFGMLWVDLKYYRKL